MSGTSSPLPNLAPLENVTQAVGHTPLIKLSRMMSPGMANVYGKCEFLNPTGSVKDRIASYIVEKAEREGKLKPGGTIIEATAGNTGLSFAMVASIKGYRCIFVLTEKFAGEKVSMLKAYGAEVVMTPSNVSADSPDSWLKTAERLVREIPGSFYVNQFQNPDNVAAHYKITGPELWNQLNGAIDCFVAGAGSGGTVTGVGRYLKEQAAQLGKKVQIVCADPDGSSYYDTFYKSPKITKRPYRVEGVGNDFIPGTLDLSVVDEVRRVTDRDAFFTARLLSRTEGLFTGGSTGVNLYAALQIARELGPGKNVVTILCDSGNRYVSKMYNDEWMRDQGFKRLEQTLGQVRDLLTVKGDTVEFVDPTEKISEATARMTKLGISQMPLRPKSGERLKMIHETDLLYSLISGECTAADPVSKAAAPLQGSVSLDDPLSRLEEIFDADNVAVAVNEGQIVGIITKMDLVRFLSSRS